MSYNIKTVVHSFSLGDVEDPAIYAGFPLSKWQDSEEGKWCEEHCTNLTWAISVKSMGYMVQVTGNMSEKDFTFFKLKFGK
jgi:hypothetical protein